LATPGFFPMRLIPHRRVLVRDRERGSLFEAVVLEVSPSGRYVKLLPWSFSEPEWRPSAALEVVEDLGDGSALALRFLARAGLRE